MWDGLLTGGSLLVPLLIGIALGDLLHGLPIDSAQNYTGSFWDLLQPYGVYTGITLVAICLLHGATFITLKTTGPVADRAAHIGARIGPVVALIVIGWAFWTHVTAGKGFWPNPLEIGIVIVVIAAAWLAWERHEGWAFACTAATIGLAMLTLFTDLYPNVMKSSTNSAYSLTIANTASPSYTLKLMSIVAVILLPVVLGYTAWNYYVFRRRLTAADFQPSPAEPAESPAATEATAPAPDGQAEIARTHPGA
jgi:cytochrome bd ubiquinol oxidase subunit II